MKTLSKMSNILKGYGKLGQIATNYVFGVFVCEGRKLTLGHIANGTGKLSTATYSRFLVSETVGLEEVLRDLGLKRIKQAIKDKPEVLISGTKVKVAVVVDATLHSRSSRHLDNSQRLCHGSSFITGHQWTNIVILIGPHVIPLPPIPFFTGPFQH
jgi:hypothetical protein